MSKFRNPSLENDAKKAAQSLREHLKIEGEPKTAIILGTGWSKSLPFKIIKSIPFEKIPGFMSLPNLEGHARRFGIGYYKNLNKPIIVLSGRIHVNESPNSEAIVKAVRLQVELLYHLGVRKLISTSAVGSLGKPFAPGNIMIVKNLFGLYAPSVLFGGEFAKPHLAFDQDLIDLALMVGKSSSANVEAGIHAMVRGPFFESPVDASVLANNADVVGMSIHTEAQVVSLYRDFSMLGLCFVSNMAGDDSSHSDVQKEFRRNRRKLNKFFAELLNKVLFDKN